MRMCLLATLLILTLAGCASKPQGFGETVASDPAIAAVEPVFVATSRQPVDDPNIMFGAARATELHFANVNVSIPVNREPGNIKSTDGKPNPAKEFSILGATRISDDASFTAKLRSALAAKPAGQRSVLLFIHGYNVPFAAGVYGAAQLRHDYQVPGIAVHYSWPSANKTALYLYDRDSAQIARNDLARTIKAIESVKPENTFVLAHSMGTLITMEALRTLSIGGHTSAVSGIDALLLAAPDIDIDVFQSQLSDIKSRPQAMVVMVSGKDRALKISSRLGGGVARLGQGTDKEDLANEGIIVLDLASLSQKGDKLNHSTFANSEALIGLVTGGFNLQALEKAEQGQPGNLIGETLGATGDLISSVLYLPAQMAGAR